MRINSNAVQKSLGWGSVTEHSEETQYLRIVAAG